jgi:hypothetical protein
LKYSAYQTKFKNPVRGNDNSKMRGSFAPLRMTIRFVLGRGRALLVWRRGGGGWDGFAGGGEGFHEFDSGAVGVEEVDLALAVDASVGFERPGVGLVGGAGFESGDCFGEVGYGE